jgi:hypothetical protein
VKLGLGFYLQPYINPLFSHTCSSSLIHTLSHKATETQLNTNQHGRANLHHDQAWWRSKRPCMVPSFTPFFWFHIISWILTLFVENWGFLLQFRNKLFLFVDSSIKVWFFRFNRVSSVVIWIGVFEILFFELMGLLCLIVKKLGWWLLSWYESFWMYKYFLAKASCCSSFEFLGLCLFHAKSWVISDWKVFFFLSGWWDY